MESNKYLIGTCFRCASCLYCKQDSSKYSCECDKNILPTSRNRTKLVPWAFTIKYNTKFNNKQIEVLEDSKNKYNYTIVFTKEFKFSFCSACNSKWYRIGKSKDTTESKKNKYLYIDSILGDNRTNDDVAESTTFNTLGDDISKPKPVYNEAENSLSENDEFDESDNDKCKHKEFLLKLCISKQEKILLPAKWLKISAGSCSEFHYQILLQVQFQLNDTTIAQNDYLLEYKLSKKPGAGTKIVNENDFKNFVEDYNRALIREKDIYINIQIQKNSLKNISKKRIHKLRSEESSNNVDDSNKKRPKLFSKKPHLNEENRIMESIISQICEEHSCAKCEGSCWPTETGHIKLTDMHYTIWARAIINGFTDIKSPPNHSMFTLSAKPREFSSSNQSHLSHSQLSNNHPLQNYFSHLFSQPPTNFSSQLPTNYSSYPPPSFLSQLPNNFSSQSQTKFLSQPPTKLISQPPTSFLQQPPTKLISQPPTSFLLHPQPNFSSQPSTNPSSQSPTKYSSQPSTKLSSQQSTKLSLQPPTKLSSQPPTKLSSQPPTKLSSQPPTNVSSQSPTNFSSQPPPNYPPHLPTNFSSQPPPNYPPQPPPNYPPHLPPNYLLQQQPNNFLSQPSNVPLQLLANTPLQTLSPLQLLPNVFSQPYYMPFSVVPNVPSLYTSMNNLTSQESFSNSTKSTLTPTPTLEEFLSKLDETENAGGEILACLTKFQDQAIRVKWIYKLTEEHLESVGIVKTGWKIALREASKKYSN